MRSIDMIVVHCTATKEGKNFDIDDVRMWHKARGWKDVGYHYVIGLDGQCWGGRKEEVVGAHASGYNQHSIGVCYVGGLDENGKPKDTRTQKQKQTMYFLLKELKAKYPKAVIVGHRDLDKGKSCPCFSVREEFGHL